jgi:hypothetical protein
VTGFRGPVLVLAPKQQQQAQERRRALSHHPSGFTAQRLEDRNMVDDLYVEGRR